MKNTLAGFGFLLALSFLLFLPQAQAGRATGRLKNSNNVVATVKHLTRVKILESNNVGLRPGSVYDNATYFESLIEFPRPGFNYEFLDSGLGAAEPLYPMYQKGNQGSYFQLGKAFISEENRHIDHYSSMETPEGCKVDGVYLLRGIDEYPETMYAKERAQGYTLIVVRLEYYTRMRPDAQCGRHRANDPDPNFDPIPYMNDHVDGMYLSDFPAEHLDKFEAKVSAIYHIKETMSPRWPRFDLTAMNRNSLWYYPQGHTFDYGIAAVRPQPGLVSMNLPKHLVIPSTPRSQARFSMGQLIRASEFQKVMDFMNGKPKAGFDPASEPGNDVLRLSDVTSTNVYTSGLYLEKIENVVKDVSDLANYRLVGMTIKPYEEQEDSAWQGVRVIPQIRFVYQLMNPRVPEQPLEQLFIHMKFDVVDRLASAEVRNAQHRYFLSRVDELTRAREANADAEDQLESFAAEFTSRRPVESIAFGSALTGIWVFGTLTRDVATTGELLPVRVVRAGVDVGYYSTTFDNDLFRAEIAKSKGARRAQLQKVMDDITVRVFRDSKRQDVHALNFNTVTCAQCHQTAGRDGVHMAFNDHLDRRIQDPVKVTEYFFHEADAQLQSAVNFWLNADSKSSH